MNTEKLPQNSYIAMASSIVLRCRARVRRVNRGEHAWMLSAVSTIAPGGRVLSIRWVRMAFDVRRSLRSVMSRCSGVPRISRITG